MPVGHLFFLDRNGIPEIIPEVQTAIPFVPVIEEEISRFVIPAVAEDDLFSLDIFHDFLG